MRFLKTEIPGLIEVHAEPRLDGRGRFVKTFVRGEFATMGLPTEFAEEFNSFSVNGVLRGMHFQLPPESQGKTVSCDHGSIIDVVLDIRIGSPTYGKSLVFELSAENGRALYIPEGLAHGFCVVVGDALVTYRTTKGYSPSCDSGVSWRSAGLSWPIENPILSRRDAELPRLKDFDSPFVYRGDEGLGK